MVLYCSQEYRNFRIRQRLYFMARDLWHLRRFTWICCDIALLYRHRKRFMQNCSRILDGFRGLARFQHVIEQLLHMNTLQLLHGHCSKGRDNMGFHRGVVGGYCQGL